MIGNGIVLSVNWIPRYYKKSPNWPGDRPGYFCGTIPSPDAACLQYSDSNIESAYPPRTFEKCCNGPIINITSPVTDPRDPSYGTSCLAYCAVDFERSSIGPGFSDYFECLSGHENGTSRKLDDTIYGGVTCGWGSNSVHERCVASVSVEMDLATKTTASLNGTATPSPSQTFATCPAETTASTTATPTAESVGDSVGKKSAARSQTMEMSFGSMFVVALMVSSSFMML